MILVVVFVGTIFSIDFSGIISMQTWFYPKNACDSVSAVYACDGKNIFLLQRQMKEFSCASNG